MAIGSQTPASRVLLVAGGRWLTAERPDTIPHKEPAVNRGPSSDPIWLGQPPGYSLPEMGTAEVNPAACGNLTLVGGVVQ
jgi:hypothetical protein